ncbi:hypothetical protein SKAU_G00237700 [Synaphobranchus kaupii]|uniref:Uncharacterized protein n=1 Tax=Synaphobranchus kaupii TaxID=118154 RepID=A0A9Q1F6Y4_SYNKA|nr:hypothetical protein SKAU_G00237700 [Synaphobranchus kaupii]
MVQDSAAFTRPPGPLYSLCSHPTEAPAIAAAKWPQQMMRSKPYTTLLGKQAPEADVIMDYTARYPKVVPSCTATSKAITHKMVQVVLGLLDLTGTAIATD